MPYDVTDFETLMSLESHGPDVFVGIGPAYPWGRVYGGQVIAQAIMAVTRSLNVVPSAPIGEGELLDPGFGLGSRCSEVGILNREPAHLNSGRSSDEHGIIGFCPFIIFEAIRSI